MVEINETLFVQMLEQMRLVKADKKIYRHYYDGKHNILYNYKMSDSQSNMKLVFNFPKKFVTSMTGYILGKPVNYISRSGDDNIINDIDLNISDWEKDHNQHLSKESEIFGCAYEINYIDSDGNFRAMVTNPMNTYALDDGTDEHNVQCAIYTFKVPFDTTKTEYMDVYLSDRILHYIVEGTSLNLIGDTPHFFNRVPVNICFANRESESGFKEIINLIDAYNVLNSDLVNEISDHRNSHLKINGATVEESDLIKMKELGIIQIPDGADVDWLIKNINDTFVQNMINNIESKIYSLVDQVDFNQQWASNTSGIALKNKLLALSHRCSLKEALMERTLKNRLKNLFTYLRVKEGKVYDYRDVKIKFTRDLPFDLTSLADSLSKLTDIVSQETLLTQLPFIENPALEIAKFQKEKAESINLDAIPMPPGE